MSKYLDLVKILDHICEEAPAENVRYHSRNSDDDILHARSRAYVHLYLKVMFGIMEFSERESYVTDGTNDGGIDAYYIDKENKKLYLIQSKFRNNDTNFDGKDITYEELFAMDVSRILEGEELDENGNQYNGKILRLENQIYEIQDFARYESVVVILANVHKRVVPKLRRIIGAYPFDLFDSERVYDELVFPTILGTFYNPKELRITLNINKESGGSRIQYYPKTEYSECTVNIQYIPTQEIGRILYQYKNSILQYNPRSYLELTNSVNDKIRSSIMDRTTNEFALFNNGITMLADETEYNDRSGRKNTAILLLKNPQIINGGQTAYTLSRIYEEAINNGLMDVFEDKEVLVKVISFNDEEIERTPLQRAKKLKLIEEISNATNQQSPVSEADRRANDKVQIELQEKIFKDFGLYYERKRGEFADGVRNKYIQRSQIIDREDFLRCCVAIINNPVAARQRSTEELFSKSEFDRQLPNADGYRRYVFAYMTFNGLTNRRLRAESIKLYARYAIVTVADQYYHPEWNPNEYNKKLEEALKTIFSQWADFEKFVQQLPDNKQYYFIEEKDPQTGEMRINANWQGYYKGRTLLRDLKDFFFANSGDDNR